MHVLISLNFVLFKLNPERFFVLEKKGILMPEKNVNILLVADDTVITRKIKSALSELLSPVFTITICRYLRTAFDRLKRGDISLILLDLYLTDSQGVRTFDSVREDFSYIPCIVIIGMDSLDDGKESVRKGALEAMLRESITSVIICRMILHALEKHHRNVSTQNIVIRKPTVKILAEEKKNAKITKKGKVGLGISSLGILTSLIELQRELLKNGNSNNMMTNITLLIMFVIMFFVFKNATLMSGENNGGSES